MSNSIRKNGCFLPNNSLNQSSVGTWHPIQVLSVTMASRSIFNCQSLLLTQTVLAYMLVTVTCADHKIRSFIIKSWQDFCSTATKVIIVKRLSGLFQHRKGLGGPLEKGFGAKTSDWVSISSWNKHTAWKHCRKQDMNLYSYKASFQPI